ncbi:PR domain zinc finger protein 2-like isoform X1, partial [Clarias magur]
TIVVPTEAELAEVTGTSVGTEASVTVNEEEGATNGPITETSPTTTTEATVEETETTSAHTEVSVETSETPSVPTVAHEKHTEAPVTSPVAPSEETETETPVGVTDAPAEKEKESTPAATEDVPEDTEAYDKAEGTLMSEDKTETGGVEVEDSEGMSTGHVVGIVFGALVAVVIIIAVIVVVVKRMGQYSYEAHKTKIVFISMNVRYVCSVKTEELLVSSEEQQYIILHCPTASHQPSLTGESPTIQDSLKEKETETEAHPDDMMEQSKEDQNILPTQRITRPAVEPEPLQPNSLIIQDVTCKTGETELKQDNKSDFHSHEADADQNPEYDPKVTLDVNHQDSCMLVCQHCQRRFTTKQGLDLHICSMSSCHPQIFKCRYCRKCFNTQFCRRRHERRHSNTNKRTGGLIISTVPQDVRETQEMVASQEEDQLSLGSLPVSNTPAADFEGKGNSEETGETKCSFACKYCKKAFGSHTSLRRHERRIHERRLLPRGVRQKVANSHKVQVQHPGGASETASHTQQQRNEVRHEEEYMVDISNNISENLSFYIDGKIISTSAVTNCEVMEMNSATALIGLDALIVNPAQIAQALKIESNDSKMTSDLNGQSSGRRRTSTPPLLPQIKTELESESILTTPSSSSEGTLIGTVFPRTLETIVLQKEKTIYLSPKLKQLLQNQDSSKSSLSLISEGQKLCPPLSLTLLPAISSRFKRRTTSPPNSPQQISAPIENPTSVQETDSSAPKVPKLDSNCMSAVVSLSKKENNEIVIAATSRTKPIQEVLPLDCSAPGTGGRSCNQQPLDLSSAVNKRDGEILDDYVLDLSMSRKSTESDSTGCLALQTSAKRTKPNSSMLEKVLLSQYAAVDVSTAADENALPTDVAATTMSEPRHSNPESVMIELPTPSPALNATPSPPNSAALDTASSAQPLSATPEPTERFLPAETCITNQELHPICTTAQSSSPVPLNTPMELSVGNSLAAFNVTLPNWLNSAPGSVTHALIPTTPTLSLQSPQFLTDTSVCDLAQRTLVIDSVLSPEAHIISPVLVNQSNISSLSFSPNVVVIEYTVALESSNTTSGTQANAIEKTPQDHIEEQELQASSQIQTVNIEPSVPELPEAATVEAQDQLLDSASTGQSLENSVAAALPSPVASVLEKVETTVKSGENSSLTDNLKVETSEVSIRHNPMIEEQSNLPTLCKRFMCNACDQVFQAMKGLSQHIGEHSDTWPYKCEFCVQLFERDNDLFEHRSSYHGIGKIYVCKICSKGFAFLCNLEQHHRDLHPGQECSHTEVENGKLRPENHNTPLRADVTTVYHTKDKHSQFYQTSSKTEADNNSESTSEELYTTIKIMASEGVKPKVTDVRLGINQHYPSFKPPPFPYHNRTPVGPTTTTATNFTTHNIPQTFSTTVRCTKCGRGFDNMPELHKHILACANASDKKRYTPKKNPIPLKQFAKVQNGVLLPAKGVNLRQNVSQKPGQPKKLHCHESEPKTKLSAHSKRKSMWVQRGRPVGRKSSHEELEVYVCPHCSREFTYHASLKKHMAFSCPMKPICRKPPKRKGSIASTQENHGRIRTRVSDVIMKPQRLNQGQKSFEKNSNESGSESNVNLPVKAHIGKGKISVRNYRPKTSDILSSSTVHISKKNRLILMEAIQSPLTSKSLVALGKSQQQSNGVHGMESPIKQRAVELKPSTEASVRVRGPITRRLQQ